MVLAPPLPDLFARLSDPSNGTTRDEAPAFAAGWGAAIDRLLALWGLEPDWDANGSPAPDRAALSGAIVFAEQQKKRWGAALVVGDDPLPPPHRIAPSCDGTVVLEWQTPTTYLEIEVLSANAADGMLVAEGAAPIHTCLTW